MKADAGDPGWHRPRAVLFDLDGTLIDTAPDLRASVNQLLSMHGLGPLSLDQVRRMIGNGVKALVENAFDSCGYSLDGEKLEGKYNAMFEIYRGQLTTLSRPMPYARAVVQALHGDGFRLGVVTNKRQDLAERILDHFALLPFMSAVIGGGAGIAAKPAPNMLLLALGRLEMGRGDAVMIGDSGIDIVAAHSAGLPIVLVRNGYLKSAEEAADADLTIADLSECEAAIGAIWKFGPRRFAQACVSRRG
ncbi:HAD-IA family hydrolase [Mesorhizobium sp. M1396]|uniref:HAD family hydrolase n=1 Tax=Mesorhizobium sp. M1396 TaxID=2957095 RepID=UPI00333DD7F0